MPLGARIVTDRPAPDPDLITAFADLPAGVIGDAMNRLFAVVGLRRIGASGPRLIGPALTVRTRPDDNLMVHTALELAQPGEVIVVAAGGYTDTAMIGELMTAHAKKRGVAGFIIDGAVRDPDALHLPVFARAISPRGPFKDGPGEIGTPVSAGGTVVQSGDLVVADDEGIVCVPRAHVEDVLGRARAIAAGEVVSRAAIEAGRWDRSWIEGALQKAGITKS